MTKAEIVEMAREAGGRAQQNKNCDVEYLLSAESIERLVELARADAIAEEREACAKVCDELDASAWAEAGEYTSGYGDEIRKRNNT